MATAKKVAKKTVKKVAAPSDLPAELPADKVDPRPLTKKERMAWARGFAK